jgi:hypothetical protein
MYQNRKKRKEKKRKKNRKEKPHAGKATDEVASEEHKTCKTSSL